MRSPTFKNLRSPVQLVPFFIELVEPFWLRTHFPWFPVACCTRYKSRRSRRLLVKATTATVDTQGIPVRVWGLLANGVLYVAGLLANGGWVTRLAGCAVCWSGLQLVLLPRNAHSLSMLMMSCCTRYEGRRLRRLLVRATTVPFAAQRALTRIAKGVVLHTLRISPVAPVVGQSHNRRIAQPLFRVSPVVDRGHNRRLTTIYFEFRRLWSVRK